MGFFTCLHDWPVHDVRQECGVLLLLFCCFCEVCSKTKHFHFSNLILQVKFEEGEMIPKSGKSPADSRKSVGIHEFAALARSSLNGNDLFQITLWLFVMIKFLPFKPLPLALSLSRYFSGSQGPCDQTHLPGPGPGGPPHRVEGLAEACQPAADHPRSLQLLLPPDWGREGGSVRRRCISLSALTL